MPLPGWGAILSRCFLRLPPDDEPLTATVSLKLAERDRRLLAGVEGEAGRTAMRLIVEVGEAMGAESLVDISSAHIVGCFYTGRVGLDFAERLVSLGARVAVPTTLNTGTVDLAHPELNLGDAEATARGRRLMELYASMGCAVTWTCAPYQLRRRPSLGEHVAWGESNAVVFANSVLGARTNRYGDFLDIAAALTGRVPDTGMHRTECRRGQILFTLRNLPARLLAEDVLYSVLGALIGGETGEQIPVIDGLPRTATEDQLKALGAAAASTGGVALFHAVGITPEAATLAAAFQGWEPERTIEVTPARLARARDALTTSSRREIDAVCLGTPHFSVGEFARLTPLLEDARVHPRVAFYVSTSRHVLAEVEARGWAPTYERAGVTLVVDTCTYFPGILEAARRVVMTNSGKWAYYAPGNLGVEVVFGSLEECVRSAVAGEVRRDERLWGDA